MFLYWRSCCFRAIWRLPLQTSQGTNVYSIYAAPKTDGAEALVLSASWLSRAVDEHAQSVVNTRGVAIVLALANYLKSSLRTRLRSPLGHTADPAFV